MERDKQNGGAMHPFAVWIIAAGAGAAGVSGVGSMGQLGQLNTTMEEQVRQAEIRGRLKAQIESNLQQILKNSDQINNMMPAKGVMELHRSQADVINRQQALIDKIIDWMNTVVTKTELNLAISKLKAIQEK